jgi:hypothetical protein
MARPSKPLNPPEGQRKRGTVPGMTAAQRAERNRNIMALFIAGLSERDIGRRNNLTGPRVHQIIKAELKSEAQHQQLLTDQALAIYTTRLDFLLTACWPKVRQGDLKAIETARRLLEQQARLYDIEEERAPALPPMDERGSDEEGGMLSSLDEYRRRHRRRAEAEAAEPEPDSLLPEAESP